MFSQPFLPGQKREGKFWSNYSSVNDYVVLKINTINVSATWILCVRCVTLYFIVLLVVTVQMSPKEHNTNTIIKITFKRTELDYRVIDYSCVVCVYQAWKPVHSSKGFVPTGPQRHSWAAQSWSLAAAVRLPRQPWPAWALPHPHHQGKFTRRSGRDTWDTTSHYMFLVFLCWPMWADMGHVLKTVSQVPHVHG